MGQIQPHVPVKLVVGLILAQDLDGGAICGKLEEAFGDVDYRSELLPFDYTDYYTREMGDSLQRRFLSFQQLIPPESLVEIKRQTNSIESRFVHPGGGRRVNLDPGYVSLAKLVLASTKNHAHRIWLGGGIYAEQTLRFHRHSFQPWEWTYPDYRTDSYIQIFNKIRRLYVVQLRERGCLDPPRTT